MRVWSSGEQVGQEHSLWGHQGRESLNALSLDKIPQGATVASKGMPKKEPQRALRLREQGDEAEPAKETGRAASEGEGDRESVAQKLNKGV